MFDAYTIPMIPGRSNTYQLPVTVVCSRCGKEKKTNEFRPLTGGRNGIRKICRTCCGKLNKQ